MKHLVVKILLISIPIISMFMHAPHLDKDLISIHVWRQTQTQTTTNSFVEEDMNILNPRRSDRGAGDGLFRMEFPLMQWLNACLHKLFGPDIIVTRLFMFFIGLGAIFGMFFLLRLLFNNALLAAFGAWIFNFSPCFYYYTINPLPDNLALCIAIWGMFLFFFQLKKPQQKWNMLHPGLLFAVAALCKLPFILYFALPFGYFIWQWRKTRRLAILEVSLAFAPVILPLCWYAWVIPQWDSNPVLAGILDQKDGIITLLDYFQHNLISTIPELFVNYGALLFFIAGLYYVIKRKLLHTVKGFVLVFLSAFCLLYYFFEANAIAKIHDYYLFPFYPLILITTAYGTHQFHQKGKIQAGVTYILLFALPFTCYLRMQNRWNEASPGFNKDWLVHKEALRNAVPNDARVVAGNDHSHFIFFYYINKKGWGFDNNNLELKSLNEKINQGAKYLYIDGVDSLKQNLSPSLDTLVLKAGSVEVYQLKNKLELL